MAAVLPDSTSPRVISFVRDNILRLFGTTLTILSDNGHQFEADLINNYAKRNGIYWSTIAPYSPKSNGRAERMVGTLKNAVLKMADKNLRQWDTVMLSAVMGY